MKYRIAVVDRDLCKPDKCGLPCIAKCPINLAGQKCIILEKENKKIIIDEKLCIGCSICVKVCPFNAITIVNFPKPLDNPIHRFDFNGFELYGLPFPIEGKIVGILGPNGIGKTSAIRILIKEIKPNFGEIGKEYGFLDLKKFFRGKEIQNYLEKFEKNEVKISYKPQRIDLIPKVVKGNVKEYLEKFDERKIAREILKEFNVDIENKKIEELSGGELQIFALAIAISKDANIYFLDEPTNFLDIIHRLQLVKIIEKFLKEKSVLIVDHDLTFLDAVCDYIQIFYGIPSVYGFVSSLYSSRSGINSFLEGYLKNENIKFRDKIVLDFGSRIEPKNEILLEFKEIRKKYENFELFVESGNIRKKEVIGIIGQNALGKSTFAKIISGEIKDFEGYISSNLKISYKPQFIAKDFNGTVQEYLESIAKLNEDAIKEILNPLGIQKLLLKNYKNLSGGEAQLVEIAGCLLKDADLYVLDEPSAFLDVEQRLNLFKNLKKFVENREKSFFIIDHDISFISHISNRILLFTGIPGKKGYAKIYELKDGLNEFLKQIGITFRVDKESKRPRINKIDSKIDREQKEKGIYFAV
ncbi:MAG: ribosome biogenesis/translation initiation ATPase RLI [Candidatus Aenigmatarchaeota archaeon]